MKIVNKAVLCAILFFGLFAQAQHKISAQVYDEQCRHFGDWKSDPYVRLQEKMRAAAVCAWGAPVLRYDYNSIRCEHSILSANATYNCFF